MKRTARLALCAAVAMSGTASGRDAGRSPSAPLADDSATAIDTAITAVTTFNTELAPHVWDGERLRPEVRTAALAMVDRLVRDSGIEGLTVDDVALVGSIASYEDNITSDFDVHVHTHADGVAPQQLSASKALLSSNIEQRQEGRIHFYGLPVEVHFYAGAPDAERVPGVGRFSILHNAWIEKPVKHTENFDRAQMAADMLAFIDRYNRLVTEFCAAKKGFDCRRLSDLDDEISSYRRASFGTDLGPRNTQNLAFRALPAERQYPRHARTLEDDYSYINESLP